MEIVELVKKKVIKVNFSNELRKLEQDKAVQFTNSVGSNVGYSKNDNICVCKMTYELNPSNNDKSFETCVVVEGVFKYDEGIDKKEVHVNAAKNLYPYLKEVVEGLFEIFGFSKFELPDIEFSIDLVTD